MDNFDASDKYHFLSLGIMAILLIIVISTLCWISIQSMTDKDEIFSKLNKINQTNL